MRLVTCCWKFVPITPMRVFANYILFASWFDILFSIILLPCWHPWVTWINKSYGHIIRVQYTHRLSCGGWYTRRSPIVQAGMQHICYTSSIHGTVYWLICILCAMCKAVLLHNTHTLHVFSITQYMKYVTLQDCLYTELHVTRMYYLYPVPYSRNYHSLF